MLFFTQPFKKHMSKEKEDIGEGEIAGNTKPDDPFVVLNLCR